MNPFFSRLQFKLAVKHLDCLVNQYGGKLTEVIGKKAARQHSDGAIIQDDEAAPGNARMASQVGLCATLIS